MIGSLLLSGQSALVPSTLQQLRVKDRDSLELAYNMACAEVLDGELDRASKLLLLAETKGNETLIEENASQGVQIHFIFFDLVQTTCPRYNRLKGFDDINSIAAASS